MYLVITFNVTIALLYILLLKFLRTNLKGHAVVVGDSPMIVNSIISSDQQLFGNRDIFTIPRYLDLNVNQIEGSGLDGFSHQTNTKELVSVDTLQSQVTRLCNTATSHLDPCLAGINGDVLSWGKRRTNRQLSSNISTSVVRLVVRPYGFPCSIMIATKDQHNMWKSFGGDYWEIRLYGDNDTVLYVDMRDQGDGTYIGYFVIPESLDNGDNNEIQFHLNYTLEYSQCNGLRDMPKDWFIKGKKLKKTNVLFLKNFE